MAEALCGWKMVARGVQALVWCCPPLDCHVSSEGWGCVPADQKHPLTSMLHLFSGPLGIQNLSATPLRMIICHTEMVQGAKCTIQAVSGLHRPT